MGQESLLKNYQFHEKIDAEYLSGMYGDDFESMEEIFATTLNYLDPDIDSIKSAFTTNQPGELKKAVHKIKPTFGFVGLLEVQHLCKKLEELCLSIQSTHEVDNEYHQLMLAITEARTIIDAEYKKLKEYNSNSI
jgi:HPt (histidine-containing phosphotransfer) domain-containing protein